MSLSDKIRDLLNLGDRDQRHYRTIQSLEYTLGADNEMISTPDAFRKKRNVA
jgi:hypothetical protein